MQRKLRVALLIDTSRTYTRGLIRGIIKYAHLHGPWIIQRMSLFYTEVKRTNKRLCRSDFDRTDGIIASSVPEYIDIRVIFNCGIPVVSDLWTEFENNPYYIATNDLAIGREAAAHLLERGFKRFAYCGFDNMPWSRQRGDAFTGKVAGKGFEVEFYPAPKRRAKRAPKEEQQVMTQWLQALKKPIGIMTCNDDRGQQILEACRIGGVHVPGEVAVIGVDNDDMICEMCSPPLSSVALNTERAGYEAARILDQLMNGLKPTDEEVITQPVNVHTRQSTDFFATEDREVAQALRFIHQNSNKDLQVNDACEAITISRRTLQKKFRRTLGHSVDFEIKRVRTGALARMLTEKNLSMSELALALGYSSISHMSRFFRREMGMSPLKYRKLHAGE